MKDLKSAVRQLLKNPGFTVVAVLTLALGLGTRAAMFSVVNSIHLRPLRYPESDCIVAVQETKLPQFPQFAVSPANFLEWRTRATCFAQLAAVRSAPFNLTGMGEPVPISAGRVTPNYLAVFLSRPAIGRDFTEEEAALGANVLLVSHGFWLRQFGGRSDLLGGPIQLDGQTFTVVGVLAKNCGSSLL